MLGLDHIIHQGKEPMMTTDKSEVLSSITHNAQALSRALTDVKRDAEQATHSLSIGEAVVGLHSFGPIGHQAPFDIVRYAAILHASIQQAIALGATDDEVKIAYTVRAAR